MTTPEVRLFRVALGTLVTKLREKHQITQAQLAERLGIAQPTIARIENGKNGVPAEKYSALARVFGMPLDKLHRRVQSVIDKTKLAAKAIRPDALDSGVDPRGLVHFVVEMTAR